jgi:hypothetical protein
MQSNVLAGIASAVLLIGLGSSGLDVRAQAPQAAAPAVAAPAAEDNDPVRTLVGRLDLEKYKATIKGLTQFGDRRQGTDRNRAAIDWIEAQLKSYGCTNTERIKYDYQPPAGRGTERAAGKVEVKARRREADSAAAVVGALVRAAARFSGTAHALASTTIPTPSRTSNCASSTRNRARLACASRCSAPRSARRDPTKCTSSAATWMASASAKRRTTMALAPRW